MPQLTKRHKIVQVFNNQSSEKFREYLIKNATFVDKCDDYHYSLTSPVVTTKLIKYNYNYKGFSCSYSVDDNNEVIITRLNYHH